LSGGPQSRSTGAFTPFLRMLTSELQSYLVVSPGDISRVGGEIRLSFLEVRPCAESRFKRRVGGAGSRG
jgi:hypothetical protein